MKKLIKIKFEDNKIITISEDVLERKIQELTRKIILDGIITSKVLSKDIVDLINDLYEEEQENIGNINTNIDTEIQENPKKPKDRQVINEAGEIITLGMNSKK